MAAHCAAAERHVLIKKKESTAAFMKVFRYTSDDLISQSTGLCRTRRWTFRNGKQPYCMFVLFCRADPTATTLVTATTLSDDSCELASTDGKANSYYMSVSVYNKKINQTIHVY